MASITQWQSNTSSALNYMNTTSSTMNDMISSLQSARTLAVQGANGTLTTSDQADLADQVNQIASQMQTLANTQVGSNYIFSGTAANQPLLPTDGSLSQANEAPVNFAVGNNISINIAVDGTALYGDNDTGIMATLTSLSTALTNGDTDGISTAITNLDTNIANVTSQAADLGARTNRITAISNQLSASSTNLQQNLSDTQGIDMAKTITDFTYEQNTYNAALAVGAKIIQPSLIDYLK
ncbi:Flagellar hook-associated protein 3 [Candidatus Desulfosporosinus infrequens]|uniref:Flagellin n=1 Tax=Candidatus Desulfosporosinus infrequens TaxID=2043169 RepID=A0A2U3LRV9_9FIRM|nr:Flagellar hook-associated protein 3 [Candidatus Desulfosporosinus infrequens]